MIFKNELDYARFLFLVLYCQSPITFSNIGYNVKQFKHNKNFRVSKKTEAEIVNQKYIELTAFILMPNHFHLLIKAIEDNGISQYMQRIQNAYTKYFNIKNKISGHLFQGPFRAIHIENNDQLLYLSAYIHKNCSELPDWRGKEADYEWSSLKDYVKINRWPNLIKTDLISDQFSDQDEYWSWIKNSSAKNSLEDYPPL